MPYVVGLTGGIGSGKSLVAQSFANIGIEIVDTDMIAHRLSAPGEAGHAAIVAEFGEDMLAPGGEIDRSRLRRHLPFAAFVVVKPDSAASVADGRHSSSTSP